MWGWVAMAALSLASTIYNRANQPDAEYPDVPAKVPPDWSPMWAFDDFTNWQHGTRNELLMDFYGGKLVNAPPNPYREPNYVGKLIDMGEEKDNPKKPGDPGYEPPPATTGDGGDTGGGGPPQNPLPPQTDPDDEGPLAGGARQMYPNASSNNQYVQFTGDKPSQQYLAGHSALLKQSDKGFERQLTDYLKSRGMAGEGGKSAIAGASQEQRRDFKQLAKEINARASEIKTQTLGQLFGEVSDAGQQTGQFANAMAQGTQMWNQMANQRYSDMMNQWQWTNANQQPSTGQMLAQWAGTMAPYALQGMGAFGSPTPPPTQPGPWSSSYVYP
jgi:hypothetical protein